jgi:hypothetical protein
MSALKVIRIGYCNDCKQPHGRPYPNVSLCYFCRKQRLLMRGKTPRYLAMRRKYNHSPKGKIRKALMEANYNAKRRAAYRRRYKKLQRIWTCEAQPCPNTFIRVIGSHRQYCDPCAEAFWGRHYVRRRNERVAKYLAA